MRFLTYAPISFMILAFALGPPFAWHVSQSNGASDFSWQDQSIRALMNGQTADTLEELYEAELPINAFSVGAMNALSIGVFGEAREGAVIGNNGWLFTDEEFTWNANSEANIAANLRLVEDLHRRIADKGVSLSIVLLPQKITIATEHIPAQLVPDIRAAMYDTILAGLRQIEGLAVVDVRKAMLEVGGDEELFLKTDTHWTRRGAEVSAHAIAASFLAAHDIQQTEFDRTERAPVDHRGDLYAFMELSVFAPLIAQPTDQITQLVVNPRSEAGSFLATDAESAPEIGLVGTSYSADPLWSFAAHLQLALGAPVVSFAEQGKGPFLPMIEFLEEDLTDQSTTKHLIWEIPVRYFDKPVDLETR
ncbi:MAG: hypothetical protein AAGH60_05080 [Pseudomonadota bacterium]